MPVPRRSRVPPPRTTTAGRAVLMVVAVLVLGALLNARQLEAIAARQPLGSRRDLALELVRPVRGLADTFGLTAPRGWIDDVTGRRDEVIDPTPLAAATTTSTATSDTTSTSASPAGTTGASGTSAAIPTTVSPSTTVGSTAPSEPSSTSAVATTAARRQPTAEAPLRLWIGGDSQMGVPGQSLVRRAVASGLITTALDVRVSTGLGRPDYFDWPAHLDRTLADWRPDAVVVLFGANDHLAVSTPSGFAGFGTPAWESEYRARVAATMDLLGQRAARVYWLGQPVARDGDYSARMAHLDQIYAQEAAGRPWVTYLSTWELLSAPGGGYSAYLPDASGQQELVRERDGIHLTRAGGDRVADLVMAALRADWQLPG